MVFFIDSLSTPNGRFFSEVVLDVLVLECLKTPFVIKTKILLDMTKHRQFKLSFVDIGNGWPMNKSSLYDLMIEYYIVGFTQCPSAFNCSESFPPGIICADCGLNFLDSVGLIHCKTCTKNNFDSERYICSLCSSSEYAAPFVFGNRIRFCINCGRKNPLLAIRYVREHKIYENGYIPINCEPFMETRFDVIELEVNENNEYYKPLKNTKLPLFYHESQTSYVVRLYHWDDYTDKSSIQLIVKVEK